MSSYLTFYLVPKEGDQKPLKLWTYSRNSDVYQAFHTHANIAYIGIEEPINYTEITKPLIEKVIDGLEEQIEDAEDELKYIIDYTAKLANINSEVYDDYLCSCSEQEQQIRDLKYALSEVEFINNTLSDLEYSSFSKMLANID